MSITKIEGMKESQAKEMSIETMNVKGYNVYFVKFDDAFGYSALVFKNDHHIYYANDYELHHTGKSQPELRELYIKALNHKLYTDEELQEPIKDYNDLEAKRYFLHNYYPMQVDSISYFFIGSDEEREKIRKKVSKMIDNKIGFCYNYERDRDFVKHLYALYAGLNKRERELKDNFDYYKSAFLYEMKNHEYGINHYQANYDTLSAFGNVKWHGDYDSDHIEDYFNDLDFNETQRKAYYAARKEYYKWESENLY